MAVIFLAIAAAAAYLAAYHSYGKFLAGKIFKLDDALSPPSITQRDDIDYVPTKKGVIFGHHFTSIAGTGPIVGPAIGIIWGWVPALLWVLLGSILMGAVHDLGSLVISLRNRGKSISEVTARYLSPRVRLIFFVIIFFELLIVIAIFGLVIAVIFNMFPQSVFPVWMEIPIALVIGWAIARRGANILLSTALAVMVMYITVALGHYLPFTMPALGGLPATGVWTVILLVYAFIASTLPVTTLLQPRDYINAWQLFIAMGLMVLGVLAAGFSGSLTLVAPAYNFQPEGAPPIFPFLFITIACGAVSGFHSLVASGTSSKQVAREKDALFVGYGSMLLESALAVLVIIAVAAGIGIAYSAADGTLLTGKAAWNAHYISWAASSGLGSKVNAMVIGSANMIAHLGIPKHLAVIIIGVFVASFAGTTLDSATRIQRYVISELFTGTRADFLSGKYAATLFAVFTAAALAFITGASGKGALKLWPLFGAVNQLLAALALIVITVYLRLKGGRKYLFTALPATFMLIVTIWSVLLNQFRFMSAGNWLLSIINLLILALSIWMTGESLLVMRKKNLRR